MRRTIRYSLKVVMLRTNGRVVAKSNGRTVPTLSTHVTGTSPLMGHSLSHNRGPWTGVLHDERSACAKGVVAQRVSASCLESQRDERFHFVPERASALRRAWLAPSRISHSGRDFQFASVGFHARAGGDSIVGRSGTVEVAIHTEGWPEFPERLE